ncbi:hypothetical protein L218DRAFT_80482 [Marasmius fiardii PR-910]|nr:hypothetical protein L218DRAFT_80482 [Marasmius fiardii PR-910]
MQTSNGSHSRTCESSTTRPSQTCESSIIPLTHKREQSNLVHAKHRVSFLEGAGDLLLGYRLPKLVQAKQKRWGRTLTNGTITSSIFTLVSGQFLIFYKADLGSLNHNRSLAIAILSHLSFICNLSSTCSSIVLANKLGRLTDVAARRDAVELAPQEGYLATSGSLFKLYGLKTSWYLMAFHWVVCFTLGIGCLLGQVIVYAWVEEGSLVSIVTTCVAALVVPPLAFALFAD